MKIFQAGLYMYLIFRSSLAAIVVILSCLLQAGCTGNSMDRNNLDLEKSPYLLQHKDNPIWWQPWGEAAFEKAKRENKMVFISIGYSTCHWCHVMEHDSFEKQDVADILNNHYVAIKIDREERPDVDQVYMSAIHMMGQNGGWPLSMFLTPDKKPFYGATYIPHDKFIQTLNGLNDRWTKEPHLFYKQSQEIADILKKDADIEKEEIKDGPIWALFNQYAKRTFDQSYGGFGRAPKFPPTSKVRALMRMHRRLSNLNQKAEISVMIHRTLEGMFRGGLFDHIGGGFTRYSTDARWEIPHFEKMLYDNATLSMTYLEAFQWSKRPLYSDVAKAVLDYIIRDMTSPEGGFYSAEDADSEGEEGKFYVWTEKELQSLLNPKELKLAKGLFHFSEKGNFEHHTNYPNLLKAKDYEHTFTPEVMALKKKLFDVREKRYHPYKDDKILTAWNGLMIEAMAKAYQVLKDDRYLVAAKNSVKFIKEKLDIDRKLKRRYREGDARFEATLADYSYLTAGLIELFQVTQEKQYLDYARDLIRRQEAHWDSEHKAYRYANPKLKDLIRNEIEFHDGAIPNANMVSALNLSKLYDLTYEEIYQEKTIELLRAIIPVAKKWTGAAGTGLIALDYYSDDSREVAIIPGPSGSISKELINVVRENFHPNFVIAEGTDGNIPLLKDKPAVGGKSTAYVCSNGSCELPTSNPEVLRKQMAKLRPINL